MEKEGLKDKKIIVWDHNRDLIYQRAQTYFNDPEAAKYIWGIGFHWYEDWSGGTPMYDNLRRVQNALLLLQAAADCLPRPSAIPMEKWW